MYTNKLSSSPYSTNFVSEFPSNVEPEKPVYNVVRYDLLKSLEFPDDQSTVCPGACQGHVEMVTPCFRFETRGSIG